MELIAGTALTAFGGYVCAQRSRAVGPAVRLVCLICLGALVVLLPTAAAPCALGAGWLLSLSERMRGPGWDIFGSGCALYGRGLLAAAGVPQLIAFSLAFWAVGWAMVPRQRFPTQLGGRALRWELSQARRAVAGRNQQSYWTIRTTDALRRAAACAATLPAAPAPLSSTVCLGASALGSGDPVTAREEFARARKVAIKLAGTDGRGREELATWLEFIGWCELAATLIDEEDQD